MRSLRIGQRLTISFAVIMLLMLLGSLAALWQVVAMRQQAARVHQASVQAAVLTRVYSQVLGFTVGDAVSQTVKQLIQAEQERATQAQAQALSEIKAAERWTLIAVIVSGVLTLLAGLGLAFLVTRSVTGPLRSLGRGAQALARGQFSFRLPENGTDELAELSQAFNLSAASLEDLYRQIEDREARFRAVIDNTRTIIYIKDGQGRYQLVNPRFQEVFGVSSEEAMGKTDRELFTPAFADVLMANDRRVLDTAQAIEVEELAPQDGATRTYLSVKVPLLGPNGRAYAVCGISTDITERQQAAQALKESEAKYRLLADNVTDVLWILDLASGRFSYVSPSVQRQRGYTPEEVLAQEVSATLATGSRQAALAMLDEELTSETGEAPPQPSRTRTLELECRRKDGSTVWTEATCSFMRDQTGRAVAVIGVSRDITKRRLVQEQLRQSEERYRRILEASPEPVVLSDMEGRVIYVNPAFSQVFGWSLEELNGRQIDYVPDEEWPATRERIEQFKRGESFSAWETRRYSKAGQLKDVSLSSAVWTDGEGRPAGSIVVLQDITKRNRMAGQLEQARKMEAIGSLAGGIAHDFNNVLQAVSGNVQLLLLKPELDQASRASLADIDNLVDRAAEMIRQLLTLSRQQVSRTRPVAVNQEIVQVCRLLERVIPRMISLEQDLAQELHPVLGDPAQVEQIVLNLAGNAVDAMPQGGRLILHTENLDLDEHFCRAHPRLTPGPHVLLRVTDTGQGMDRATQAHIFDPFFTTKPPGQGTGLGLSTVYSIVENHGGMVTCYSAPGQGAVFNIYLPALPGAAIAPVAEGQPAQPLPGGEETVLIVDDEPSILDTGREILEMHGYRVLTADSGERALDVYQEQAGAVALVILDLGMPGMGGRGCLQRLLAQDPGAKVVISSGYATDSAAQDLRAMGAAGFINKPYRLSDMVKTVRAVLDRA
ncbi:MAG: PAS domain S-box protein [Pseudomonadota bacterium]